MTADAGAGVEIGTMDPGFVVTKKVVADSKAYTVGGAVRGRCLSVPHPGWSVLKLSTSLGIY